MQIALTKKLTDAMGVKPQVVDETVNPLYSWTANWTTVWEDRRAEGLRGQAQLFHPINLKTAGHRGE